MAFYLKYNQHIVKTQPIYKATLEIIYNLRNALFHGEIAPDKDTNKVYEAAYRVMRQLVIGLKYKIVV